MAATWTVVTDVTLDEADDWTPVLAFSTLNREGCEWSVVPAILDPNSTAATSIQNFGGWAAEDFNIIPELVTAVPEVIQADYNEWAIQSEPN